MKTLFSALLLLVLCGVGARAETPADVPNPLQTRRSWVADNANVLSAATERRINDLLTPLERKTGAEVAVATVNDLGGQSVEDFANDLFKRWKIGKKSEDNGVLLLVAVRDRKMRIEVGYGLDAQITDAQAKQITSTLLKPAFKRNDFNGGIYEGTYAIARRLDPALPARSASPASSPSKAPAPQANNDSPFSVPDPNAAPDVVGAPSFAPDYLPSGGGVGGLLLLGLLVGGGGVMTLVYLSSRPPRCPQCKTGMELVPESQEDPYLSDVQQLEERLGGREWNVWRCPRDGFIAVMSHDKWLSSVEKCRFCANRTATSTTQVLQHASQFQSGLEETTHICHNPACRHTWTTQRTIPREAPVVIVTGGGGFGGGFGGSDSGSSSSGSSSYDSGPSDFGGGDSGGAGASDSW